MTDMTQLPNDVDGLKQMLLERDATLAAIDFALHGAQLHFDQIALLLRKSCQMQHSDEARQRVATFAQPGSTGLKNMPNFAESECSCPQCTSKPRSASHGRA